MVAWDIPQRETPQNVIFKSLPTPHTHKEVQLPLSKDFNFEEKAKQKAQHRGGNTKISLRAFYWKKSAPIQLLQLAKSTVELAGTLI